MEVERLIQADSVQMPGPIRQELLSGAQPQERFAQLKDYWRFYPNLPLDEEDDENAAHYYNLCRQKGIQSTGTDLLICAVAVRHGLRIFTTDSDFDHYAQHLPIPVTPSQPGGDDRTEVLAAIICRSFVLSKRVEPCE